MHAQRAVAQANIPFDFEYGKAHLHSGRYTVDLVASNTVELQSRPSSAFGMVQWNSTTKPLTTGKLVFRKYGDVYILKEIWMAGETEHASVPQTRSQRALEELAKDQSTAAPSDIIVTLVQPIR